MAFLTFLHGLPEWGVYLLIVPVVTGVAAAMPVVGRRLFGIAENDDRSRGALEAYKAIVSSMAFLLAFFLVQAQDTLRSLERVVSQEAAALTTIDRSLLRYDSPDLTDLRSSLHDLVRRIVAEEWPALVHGERSPRAEALVDTLSRRIRTTEPTSSRQQSLLTELVAKLDEFTDRREDLITGATNTLPLLFWNTLAALLLVLAALAAFVTPNRERTLTIAGITVAVSLVLCLVIIADAPFAGGSTISPAPLERALTLMQARRKVPVAATP